MLSLHIRSGEYITIGDDIIVQVFREGADARVEIKAPREMKILRGELHEKSAARPDGLLGKRPKSPSELTRNAKNMERLAEKKAFFEAQRQEILSIAAQLDHLGDSFDGAQIKALARQLVDTLVTNEAQHE